CGHGFLVSLFCHRGSCVEGRGKGRIRQCKDSREGSWALRRIVVLFHASQLHCRLARSRQYHFTNAHKAEFTQHTKRAQVGCHRTRDNGPCCWVRKRELDKRLGGFGRDAPPPRGPMVAVADFYFVRLGPAEFAGVLGGGRGANEDPSQKL